MLGLAIDLTCPKGVCYKTGSKQRFEMCFCTRDSCLVFLTLLKTIWLLQLTCLSRIRPMLSRVTLGNCPIKHWYLICPKPEAWSVATPIYPKKCEHNNKCFFLFVCFIPLSFEVVCCVARTDWNNYFIRSQTVTNQEKKNSYFILFII